MEIERKFLVKEFPQLDNLNPLHIKQGYLSFKPEIRLREIINNNKVNYYLTIKSDGDISREEYEIEISKNTFEELSENVRGIIKKKRYKIPLNNTNVAELDIYEDLDLVIVEVEFNDISLSKHFIIPNWFGKEITYDNTYKNKNLIIRKGWELNNE